MALSKAEEYLPPRDIESPDPPKPPSTTTKYAWSDSDSDESTAEGYDAATDVLLDSRRPTSTSTSIDSDSDDPTA